MQLHRGRAIPSYVKDALSRIATHFGPMGVGKSISQLSSQLKSYIENSGIFFEKKLENVIIKSFEINKTTSRKGLPESPEIQDMLEKT